MAIKMSSAVGVSMDVTTAELAAMSSEALRQAVGRGRQAEEFEKELGLVRTMNRMLMEQIEELKDKLLKEKEKRQGGGVAHENGRLEEDPEDDELPRLRLANEALLTRQQMLEAQVHEAARYNDIVASDLTQAKQKLKAQIEANARLESKNAQLAYDIEVLQASSSTSNNHAASSRISPRGLGGFSLSPEAIEHLEAENRGLSERVAQLQEKNESRKNEVKNLKSNVAFLKTKMAELTAKVQSNEAVNDAALQKLKQHLASPPDSPNHGLTSSNGADLSIPGFSSALNPDGPNNSLSTEISSICGILDSEQVSLLESASQELKMLSSTISTPENANTTEQNAPTDGENDSGVPHFNNIRDYFNTKLALIENNGAALPTNIKLGTMGASLQPIAEDSTSTPSGSLRVSGSVPVSSSANSSAPGSLSLKSSSSQVSLATAGSKWHEYDASFLVLSVMLIQKLTSTNDRLAKKRREFADLQEDFNEYKRSQAAQTPRSATGSRKMSAEAQQITLQKKMNELEKNVQSLTAASNEKENQLVSARSQLAELTADLESKSASLEEVTTKHSDLEKAMEENTKELQEKADKLKEARDAEELLKAEAASLLASISQLEGNTTDLNTQLEDSKKKYSELQQQMKEVDEQVLKKDAAISGLEGQVNELKTDLEDFKANLEEREKQFNEVSANLKAKGEELDQVKQSKDAELEKKRNEIEAKQAEIEKLIMKSDSYAEEVKSTKASLEITQNELTEKAAEAQRLSGEVDRLTKERDAQSEEIKSIQHKLNDMETQLEESQKSLAGKIEEVAQLSKDIEKLKSELNAQNEEIKAVKSSLASTEAQLEETKTSLSAKSNEVSQLSEEVNQLKTDKATLSEEISTVKSSLASTEAQLEETKTSLSAKSNEASQLSEEVNQLKTDKNTLSEEISTVKSSLASVESQLEETKTLLSTKSDEAAQLSQTVTQLTENKTAQEKEIESINSTLASTKSQLESKNNEADKLSQTVNQLNEDKKLQSEEIASIKAHLASTETQLAETKSTLESKSNEADQHSQTINQLNSDKEAQQQEISTLNSTLASTTSQLEETKSELVKTQELLEKTKTELQGTVSTLESDLESTRSQLETAKSKLAETESSLASLSKESASQLESITALKKDKESQEAQITELETVKRRLEQDIEMRTQEAYETMRSMTLKLNELQTFKDGEIAQLQTKLNNSVEESKQRAEKIANLETDLATSKAESNDRAAAIAKLESDLVAECKEKENQSQGRERAEKEALETKEALAQLETTTAQSIASLEQSIHAFENERSGLLLRIEEAKRVEENMATEIMGLQVKARELDAWQKKLPEITDESLEAEERAATKWIEYTLNKEKATTSHNSFATFLNQVAHGTQSPSSAAQLAAGASGAAVRKITKLGDALRQPSFLASVINLVKKDAFSEATIKRMEEIEAENAAMAAATATASSSSSVAAPASATSSLVTSNAAANAASLPSSSTGPAASTSAAPAGSLFGSESDTIRALEECLSVARSVGLKINGVTAALLHQGNRRAIVDFSLEVIRTVTTARTSVRAHPELSLLFVGMDEDKMNSKSSDKVLLKWVNSFIEDFNATHPELTPPRPLITNLGRDLSDGKALGIVMATINPKDWAPLGDSSSLDLVRKCVNLLQTTVWRDRLIPPFVDSPVPIMRGDENVLTILLAQLLEYNTGLASPLAKMQSLHTSSTTSMLSATTPSRNQVRAVSGANMTDSPLKTPIASKGPISVTAAPSTASARSASLYSASATPSSTPVNNNKTSANGISIKAVEEPSRWKFW